MTPEPVAAFEPDSSLVCEICPSANINERRITEGPSILILHYTGLPDCQKSIDVLRDPAGQVSCHYVIDVDGRIIQMVKENMRAWHAGVSFWKGHTDLNSMSIGIEIQNPGHDGGYPDFPDIQMQSVVALAKSIVDRNAMRPEHVLAHSDVAPQRKNDPGEKFDWQRLWQAGVGHWVKPEPLGPPAPETAPELADGADEPTIRKFQELASAYGYDCPVDGLVDDRMLKVIIAFQRHFRPAQVDGRIDTSTLQTLKKLHASMHNR